MSSFNKKCLIYFEFISTILIIISFILYTIQSFINQNFTKNKSKSAYTEKLLYQKFAEEIYTNIHSYPIKKIKTSSNKTPLILQVKLDTFYDCQGVKNGLLNEEICQNKIVNNLTCCKSTCCHKDNDENFFCNNYDFNVKQSSLDKNILVYNYDEMLDDPKRRYCEYINKFSGNTSKVLDYNLGIEILNYSYENILLNNNNNINSDIKIAKKDFNKNKENIDFIDCGEVDSLKNHLFLKGIDCPINYINKDGNKLFFDFIPQSALPIIVNNYLTEIPPSLHEWNNKYDSEIVTLKDIKNLVNKNKDNSDDDNYYKKQDAYFYIDQLPEFREKYTTKVNPKQKIYWYTTNYIGFDTAEDLKNFKSIFNENDLTDNPLYRMTELLYPSIETSIICIILIPIYVIFLIFLEKHINQNNKDFTLKTWMFKLKKLFSLLLLIIYFFIFLKFIKKPFKKININIDSNYQKILDLYNERRKQKYFLAGIILHFIAFACDLNCFFECSEKKKNKRIKKIKGSENDKIGSIIGDNKQNLSDTIEYEVNDKVVILQNHGNRLKDSLKFSIHASDRIIPFQNQIDFK